MNGNFPHESKKCQQDLILAVFLRKLEDIKGIQYMNMDSRNRCCNNSVLRTDIKIPSCLIRLSLYALNGSHSSCDRRRISAKRLAKRESKTKSKTEVFFSDTNKEKQQTNAFSGFCFKFVFANKR